MHPQVVVMQRVDDADVALVVHHDQVQQERQEEEVGEDVRHHAGAEAQLPVEAHEWDEGQHHARAQVRHQQAEEEVVGRVVELPVAGDAQDDGEVGQDDGGRQRDGDGVDELLLGQQGVGVVAFHLGKIRRPAPNSSWGLVPSSSGCPAKGETCQEV